MAIALRNFTETNFAAGVTTLTLTKPTGTVDDDIVVAACYGGSSNGYTAPAGFAEFSFSPHAAFGAQVQYFWKRASSEGASWNFTCSSQSAYGLAVAWSGCITSGDPQDATGTADNANVSKNVSSTGLTTNTDNALVFQLWTNRIGTGGDTPPAGYTESGGPNNTFGIEYKIITPAGATGTVTTTIVNFDDWSACLIALKPPITPLLTIGTSLSKVTAAINTIEPLTTNSPRLNAYFEHFWGGR